LNADLQLAERVARAAGAELLARYGRPPEGLGSKSSATDPVSDADRAAERIVLELLTAERPDDGLVAEEGSAREALSGRRWVVDPLDGTVNYLYGFPAWGVSVALEDDAGGLVGVVHDPLRGETFRAARGEGAELVRTGGTSLAGVGSGAAGGAAPADAARAPTPLRVAEPRPLDRALVATGFSYEPARRAEQAAILGTVLPQVRDIRRAGAAALDLCALAAGRVDAYYERGLNHWDWAAAALLVREAGGTVAALAGEPAGLVAASTPELLRELSVLVSS
jgi:myo-inositol-1(or 4)-monophosphatase